MKYQSTSNLRNLVSAAFWQRWVEQNAKRETEGNCGTYYVGLPHGALVPDRRCLEPKPRKQGFQPPVSKRTSVRSHPVPQRRRQPPLGAAPGAQSSSSMDAGPQLLGF